MLATQCSKPIATNPAIGSRMPSTLSDTERAANPMRTARQTSTLHRMPHTNSVSQLGVTLTSTPVGNNLSM